MDNIPDNPFDAAYSCIILYANDIFESFAVNKLEQTACGL
jgi:hypothetical protein